MWTAAALSGSRRNALEPSVVAVASSELAAWRTRVSTGAWSGGALATQRQFQRSHGPTFLTRLSLSAVLCRSSSRPWPSLRNGYIVRSHLSRIRFAGKPRHYTLQWMVPIMFSCEESVLRRWLVFWPVIDAEFVQMNRTHRCRHC